MPRSAYKRCRLVAGSIITFIFLATASPGYSAPFTRTLELDYQIALNYWGRSPLTFCSSIDREVVPAGSLTFEPPPGYTGSMSALALSTPTAGQVVPCVLWIDKHLAGLGGETKEGCRVMIREVGHLIGYPDIWDPSVEPESVENIYSKVVPPICRQAGNLARRIRRNEFVTSHLACTDDRCWARKRRLTLEMQTDKSLLWSLS